ncbi:polymorphic toxin-type HINT domain-containing protein [Singulisphaera sp. PoT]|uniref:polymorphic toxin-type HINT domain-containing protein n=1 Tax=Singulisphaera sp. PoT TaxID=3411797 RepID=UPI003BF5B605
MFASLLLGIGMTAFAADTAPSAEAQEAYTSAKAAAGRDSDSQVKLALWCEAHGLAAERLKHLALAVLLNPKDARARALMGLVAFNGRWAAPDALSRQVESDEAMGRNLAEYNARRAKTPHTAAAHWQLALWCEENGLKPEAIAHLTTVVRLDPKRDAAWKRLGYRRERVRWVTEAQIEAARAELEEQKRATQRWRKELSVLSTRLESPRTKTEALKGLAEVNDPRAVPAIWSTFVANRKPRLALAAQLLGQVDSPLASRSLVYLGLSTSSGEVRRLVSETLKRRDPCEYAGIAIALIRDPIKYEVKDVEGPGSPGTLFVSGKKVDYKRQYTPATLPNIPPMPTDSIYYDDNGLPVINRMTGIFEEMASLSVAGLPTKETIHQDLLRAQRDILAPSGEAGKAFGQFFIDHPPSVSQWVGIQSPYAARAIDTLTNTKEPGRVFGSSGYENVVGTYATSVQIPVGQMALEAQRSVMVAEQRLREDVASLESTNADIDRSNKNVLELLTNSTGEDFGPNQKGWDKWFADQQGYAFTSNESDTRPVFFEEVTSEAQPVAVTSSTELVGLRVHACFAAGTEVATMTGRRPIESLRAGDRVLTWDTATGALGLQPILTVFHNPPSKTLRLEFEDDAIVTTPWHRFWIAGKGWVVARDLKAGDVVRTLARASRIVSISPAETQLVYNLEVAQDHDYLVGERGALVHDNSFFMTAGAPFDGTMEVSNAPKRP